MQQPSTHSESTPPVTIIDVARAAGVSHSTVSRVLNRHPNIRPETRERVEEAVASLGYVPNLSARSLARGRPSVVAMTLFNIGSPYSVGLVRGVDAELIDAGLHLLLYATRRGQGTEFADLIASGLAQGLLVAGVSDGDAFIEELVQREFPVILIDQIGPTIADSIVGDNEAGAAAAVDHLLDLGHRRIGIITGDIDRAVARVRRDAALSRLATRGQAPIPGLVVDGSFRERGGYLAAGDLLDRVEPPTAIIAPSDAAAFGVLRAALERGVAVPEQLSVVGYDNVADAAFSVPPLTTINQPLGDMARCAVEMLWQRMADRKRDIQHVVLPAELIVRSSTSPPPA